MNTAAICTGAEIRIPETGSVQLDDPAPWVDAHAPERSDHPQSAEVNDPALCYEAACEFDLVSAAKNGDQCAFVELHRRYRPLLKRRIRRIVRNLEDAEDVLQDTMMSAFRHLAGFRGKCSFRTWIMTIATNNSLMLLRKRRNHAEIGLTHVTTDGKEVEILEVFDPSPNPEEVYARRQASQRIFQTVRMLPAGFRQVVERYHITGTRSDSLMLRMRSASQRPLRSPGCFVRETHFADISTTTEAGCRYSGKCQHALSARPHPQPCSAVLLFITMRLALR
jgi:RNA polymerase sigma factor (sigma-70 family)